MRPDVDFKKIGNRIKNKRLDMKLKQAEFADMIGVTKNHLGEVERGQCGPSIDLLIAISWNTNTSVDYFLMDSPHISQRYLVDMEIHQLLAQCSPDTLKHIFEVVKSSIALEKALKE